MVKNVSVAIFCAINNISNEMLDIYKNQLKTIFENDLEKTDWVELQKQLKLRVFPRKCSFCGSPLSLKDATAQQILCKYCNTNNALLVSNANEIDNWIENNRCEHITSLIDAFKTKIELETMRVFGREFIFNSFDRLDFDEKDKIIHIVFNRLKKKIESIGTFDHIAFEFKRKPYFHSFWKESDYVKTLLDNTKAISFVNAKENLDNVIIDCETVDIARETFDAVQKNHYQTISKFSEQLKSIERKLDTLIREKSAHILKKDHWFDLTVIKSSLFIMKNFDRYFREAYSELDEKTKDRKIVELSIVFPYVIHHIFLLDLLLMWEENRLKTITKVLETHTFYQNQLTKVK